MRFAYQHALWLLLMTPLALWCVRLQGRVGNSTLCGVLGSRMYYAKSRLVVRLLSVRGFCSSSWCSCSFAVRYWRLQILDYPMAHHDSAPGVSMWS